MAGFEEEAAGVMECPPVVEGLPVGATEVEFEEMVWKRLAGAVVACSVDGEVDAEVDGEVDVATVVESLEVEEAAVLVAAPVVLLSEEEVALVAMTALPCNGNCSLKLLSLFASVILKL